MFEEMCPAVVCIDVGGAQLKAAAMLKGRCVPRVVLICRGASRASGIACKGPLGRASGSKVEFERLFKQKRAVLKYIGIGNELKATLEACQTRVVGRRCQQGWGGSNAPCAILHSPIRLESMAAP